MGAVVGGAVMSHHRQCLAGGPNAGCNIAAVRTIPNDGVEWLAYGVGSAVVVLFSQKEEDQETMTKGLDSKRSCWSLWQMVTSEHKKRRRTTTSAEDRSRKTVVEEDDDVSVTSVAWMQGGNHVSLREGVGRFPWLISSTSRFIDVFHPRVSVVTAGSMSENAAAAAVGNRNLPCFEWVASYDAWQLPSPLPPPSSREGSSFFSSTLEPWSDLDLSRSTTLGLLQLQRVAGSVWDPPLPVARFDRNFKSSSTSTTAAAAEQLRSKETDQQSHASTRFIVASTRDRVHVWSVLVPVPDDTLLQSRPPSTTEFRLVHVFEYLVPFEDPSPCLHQRKLQSAQERCSVLLACLDGGVSRSVTPNVLFATASPNAKIVWVCNVLMSEIDASSPPILFEEKLVHPCRVQSFQWKPPCAAAQTSEIVVRICHHNSHCCDVCRVTCVTCVTCDVCDVCDV